MSETPSSQPKPSEWRSPQVILPIIATISTVLVAVIGVLPSILEANKPAVTPTPMVILIATPIPQPTAVAQAVIPTAVSSPLPSSTPPPTIEPTLAITTMSGPSVTPLFTPTDTSVPPSEGLPLQALPTMIPNLTLFYDSDSFTVWNSSGNRLSLVDVTFRGGSITWDMSQWGSLVKPLPNNKCLRLRDALIGERTPPTECTGQIHGFFKVGHAAIFWRDVDQFDVLKNGSVIATCAATAGVCPIYVEQ